MKPGAWSYSSITMFDNCPRRYQAEKVTKEIKFTDTDATIYGKDLHLAAENYIGKGEPVPPKFSFLQGILDRLNHLPGVKLCEYKMGIALRDGVFEPCDFFASDVYWRGIADLIILDGDVARCIDYKSGKSAKYADTKQLGLLAAAIFLHFPEVKVVKSGLLFVISGDFIKEEYTYERRFDIFAKLDPLLRQREIAYETDVWNPKPSGLCKRHCPVTSCPHNGANQ
jgi:hypothetical protein